MIGGTEFRSAGTELNRMMDKLGFPDPVGDIYGAALDSAIGDNAGAARNLLDAYSPFTTSQLDTLTRMISPAASMRRPETSYAFRNPMQGYGKIYSAGFPGPATAQHLVSSMLNRLSPQNFAPVLAQFSGVAPGANQNVAERLSSTLEMVLDRMMGQVEKKMEAQEAAAPPRKKKKKGLGSKIGKAFKKITHAVTKPVTHFARKVFSDAFKHLNFTFSNVWHALRSGNIFQLGHAFAGGLVGGPVGGIVLDQLMKAAGKKNPLGKVFEQFQQSLDVVRAFQANQADLHRSLLQRFIR